MLKQDLEEALEAYRNGDSFALGRKITHTANDIITLTLAARVVRNTTKVAKAYGIDNNTLTKSFVKHKDRGRSKAEISEQPRERIKFPEASNMREFFNLAFGKLLEPHSVKTDKTYQGSVIYRLEKDIGHPHIGKGDYFYIDKMHRDHIEVFTRRGKAKAVLSTTGEYNVAKTAKAKDRTIPV